MMKLLFFLIAMLALCSSPGADLYVWQRRHSPGLTAAIREFYRKSPGKLYFLAGEWENDGRRFSAAPPSSVDPARTVPVIRIHVRHLEKTPEALAEEILAFRRPWRACRALQIDLDAPESKLDYYAALIGILRKKLPGVELSATVLPCHLRRREFDALAAACDYYVLQVHGLALYGGQWRIIDRQTALGAWETALKLRRRFKLALPLYCASVKDKTVTPDMALVAGLARTAAKHGGFVDGVIGFRMGIPGDGGALDMETALALCREGRYEPELRPEWSRTADGAWHLTLVNRGFFPEKTTLALVWEKDFPIDDFGTFNGASANHDLTALTLTLPPSGGKKVCLWLRSEKDPSAGDRLRITGKEAPAP